MEMLAEEQLEELAVSQTWKLTKVGPTTVDWPLMRPLEEMERPAGRPVALQV
jgi:hypothetical protein